MKHLLLSILIFLSFKCLSQFERNTFQGGIEVGLSFTTIQPYLDLQGFYGNVNFYRNKGLRTGLFVNRFITYFHQLETGLYYSQKGIYYSLDKTFYPSKLNYIEMPLVINYFPHNKNRFCYSLGLGYFHLIDDNSDYNNLYRNYDIAAIFGLKFQAQQPKWLNKCMINMKFDGSLLPISIKEAIANYNNESTSSSYMFLPKHKLKQKQRNYSITIGIQYYL